MASPVAQSSPSPTRIVRAVSFQEPVPTLQDRASDATQLARDTTETLTDAAGVLVTAPAATSSIPAFGAFITAAEAFVGALLKGLSDAEVAAWHVGQYVKTEIGVLCKHDVLSPTLRGHAATHFGDSVLVAAPAPPATPAAAAAASGVPSQ